MSDETEQTAKALQHCAKSVDTWLASGANENKTPRAQIAALSAWAKESCQAALASQQKPAPVLLTDEDMREALELIAAPKRPDGTWNRDREACRQLAAEALGRYDENQKGV